MRDVMRDVRVRPSGRVGAPAPPGRAFKRGPAALVLLAACTASGAGEQPGAESPTPRVVSLAPSVTDLIVALGAHRHLVGRTTFDTDPRLAHLPAVGGASDPNVERLVELRPDLVLVWEEGEAAALAGRLASFGVAARRVRTETLDDLRATLDSLGSWLGRERAAGALRREIDSAFAAVRARVARRPAVPVMYLVWDDPPVVAGAASYAHALIELAGGANVFGDVDDAWPEVSVEAIVQRDPSVIVWPRERPADDALTRLARAAGWRDLAAVRGGRVYLVPADRFNRLGPAVGAAADTLARLLHP